jgi:hypothetical protein
MSTQYELTRSLFYIGANAIPGSNVVTRGMTEADLQPCFDACDSNNECVGFERTQRNGKYNCLLMKPGPLWNLRFGGFGNNDRPKIYTINGRKVPKIKAKFFNNEEKNIQEKMDAVQNVPGSEFASQGERYQETMMSGVMWASIGTLVLFFVFNKMS